MKTFAQLKKDIKEGTKIKTILNNYKPEKNGEVRTIGKVQSNAIAFNIPEENQKPDFRGVVQTLSWLWWNKAGCYEYESNTFTIFEDTTKKQIAFIYEIMEG